jgi:hypothetical protein
MRNEQKQEATKSGGKGDTYTSAPEGRLLALLLLLLLLLSRVGSRDLSSHAGDEDI